jgi:hypothetical protein
MVVAAGKVDQSVRDETFLDTFKASDCYLIDLCRQPVDRLPLRKRQEARPSMEAALAGEFESIT